MIHQTNSCESQQDEKKTFLVLIVFYTKIFKLYLSIIIFVFFSPVVVLIV